jgi:hypothetical protein
MLLIIGCQTDVINDNEVVSFKINKAEITLNNDVAIIKTENKSIDFENNTIHSSENIYFENGKIKSTTNSNIWFVPFNKDELPVLLGSKKADPEINVSCDCSQGTIGNCDVSSQTTGNTTTFKCRGGCSDPEEGTPGTCDQTTTVTQGKLSSPLDIFNSIIISSNSVQFNGNMYIK